MSAPEVRVVARPARSLPRPGGPTLRFIALASLGGCVLLFIALAVTLLTGGGPAETGAPGVELPDPGPSRLLHGLPAGFAHTPSGAEAAAARIDLVLTRMIDRGESEPLTQAARLYATPSYAPVLSALLGSQPSYERSHPAWSSAIVIHRLIIATELSSYSAQGATVRCWQLALAMRGGPPVVAKCGLLPARVGSSGREFQ